MERPQGSQKAIPLTLLRNFVKEESGASIDKGFIVPCHGEPEALHKTKGGRFFRTGPLG